MGSAPGSQALELSSAPRPDPREQRRVTVKRALPLLLLALFAVGMGWWLGDRSRSPSTYEMERMALGVTFVRTILPFKVAFSVLLGGIVLLTLAGLGWNAIRWLNRRMDLVYPDHHGLYPIREHHIGRATVVHDSNRTLTGTTVYASGDQRITVQHPVPQNHLSVQQQVTAQAQVAQALRAAVSGTSALPAGRTAAVDLLERRAATAMPEVQELPYEPSHIERLLLLDGK